MIPHIPILRHGEAYESLDVSDVVDHRTGDRVARISQANTGLIRRDLNRRRRDTNPFSGLTITEIFEICCRAGSLFMTASLPCGRMMQTPDDYIRQLSRTSGLPYTLCRRNMSKIHSVLTEMQSIVSGLTRQLDAAIFDGEVVTAGDTPYCFYRAVADIGVVLPSNSPGVNSLWLPAIPLKTPVVLKPGSLEPWTPWRIIQALISAGCPREAFCFYPTGHTGADTIVENAGSAIVFGDQRTIDKYAANPRVNVHGPGHSKVIFGADLAPHWQDYIDIIVESVAANGGRSCINASMIVTPSHADAIAHALAERLASLNPLPMEVETAALSAFSNTGTAEAINTVIERGLDVDGAIDVSADYRTGDRLIEVEGSSFLQPTVIRCASLHHPLAQREFMFPYVSVVETDYLESEPHLNATLAATILSDNRDFVKILLQSSKLERINLGAIPTTHVRWDQPHEGNLFEFLYHRRAIQGVTAVDTDGLSATNRIPSDKRN